MACEGDECVAPLTPAEDCGESYDPAVLAISHPVAGLIIGGSVYEGQADDLAGHHICGDSITGRNRFAVIRNGTVSERHDLTSQPGLHRTLASVDVDSRREMHLVNVFKGTIHRIVPTG